MVRRILKDSGSLALTEIQTIFGGLTPIALSEYYRNGAYVPDIPLNSTIPYSGTIKISDFYGTGFATFQISSSFDSRDEGLNIDFLVQTQGFESGTLYWTIEGVSGSITDNDFSFPSNAVFGGGTVNINESLGNITLTINADQVTEGVEDFRLRLRYGSNGGRILATSNTVRINDTSVAITYTLSRSASTVNEGGTQIITLNTTGVANNTTVPYTVTGINSADLSSGSLTGNFTIQNNTASVSFTFANDFTTEGPETATLTLGSPGTGNISWTVNDTSVPTYALSRSASSVSEGGSVTITLTTQGVPNGTLVPYTISGVSAKDLTSNTLTGNFTVNSNTATQTFTFVQEGSADYIYTGGTDVTYGRKVHRWNRADPISGSSFNNSTAQLIAPQYWLWWHPDGTSFFFGSLSGEVREYYNLTSEWDATTAQNNRTRTVTSPTTRSMQGGTISSNGLRFYAANTSDDYVYQYNLSTAWDITTMTQAWQARYFHGSGSSGSYPNSTRATIVNGLYLSPDGSKMYLACTATDRVFRFNLSTNYDVSTASYHSQLSIVATGYAGPLDMTFNSDGNRMYILNSGSSGRRIEQWNLSTAWDITTASLNSTYTLPSTIGDNGYEPSLHAIALGKSAVEGNETFTLSLNNGAASISVTVIDVP
jgi:hypothetical protein